MNGDEKQEQRRPPKSLGEVAEFLCQHEGMLFDLVDASGRCLSGDPELFEWLWQAKTAMRRIMPTPKDFEGLCAEHRAKIEAMGQTRVPLKGEVKLTINTCGQAMCLADAIDLYLAAVAKQRIAEQKQKKNEAGG